MPFGADAPRRQYGKKIRPEDIPKPRRAPSKESDDAIERRIRKKLEEDEDKEAEKRMRARLQAEPPRRRNERLGFEEPKDLEDFEDYEEGDDEEDDEDGEEEDELDQDGPKFEEQLDAQGFLCPPRLRGRDAQLVEEVNTWHFSMLNDEERARFYWDALSPCVRGKRVLDLGTGSGLLAMMAAKLGADEVIAVEANSDLVAIAERSVKKNGFKEQVTILHALSTDVDCEEQDKVDIIVSETLGTLLNGESTLDFIADARKRLSVPNVQVIPAGGAQDVVLISSPTLELLTSVREQPFHGIDLSAMDAMKDTVLITSPNEWGIRFSELEDLTLMSPKLRLFELDFAKSRRQDIPQVQEIRFTAQQSGVIHAVVCSWEVWGDQLRKNRFATHIPKSCTGLEREASSGSTPRLLRDNHFSQAMQLLEDVDAVMKGRSSKPVPFVVQEGEELLLRVLHNSPRTNMQFSLHRDRVLGFR